MPEEEREKRFSAHVEMLATKMETEGGKSSAEESGEVDYDVGRNNLKREG